MSNLIATAVYIFFIALVLAGISTILLFWSIEKDDMDDNDDYENQMFI
jgi:nitrogen fixation-related uncharacterized protein